MSSLLAPLRLTLRALDDLHAIALTGADLGRRLSLLEERFDRIEGELGEAIGVARQIDGRAAEVLGFADDALELGRRIDARAGALLALGERVDVRAGAIIDLGAHVEALIGAMVEEAKLIEAAAQQVAATGAEVATALPLLHRAIEMTEPLEGAVERIGRIVDRLPGGRAATRPGRAARGE